MCHPGALLGVVQESLKMCVCSYKHSYFWTSKLFKLFGNSRYMTILKECSYPGLWFCFDLLRHHLYFQVIQGALWLQPRIIWTTQQRKVMWLLSSHCKKWVAFAVRSLSGSPVAIEELGFTSLCHPQLCRALGVLFSLPWKISYKHISNLFLKGTWEHPELKVKVAFIRHFFNHLFEEELNIFSLH